ncbi:MAG: DUF554 domain-containing protein, partial [Oscillospiraceae bacterium]|nr:DUF554 domain-containing protein [Oscillospiraceae bacterium]
MIGTGTLANTAAVVVGGALGMVMGNKMKPAIQDTLMHALGMATMFIGISGTLKEMLRFDNGALTVEGSMLMIVSLVIGSVAGAWLEIEKKLDDMGVWMKNRVKAKNDSRFVEGFVTTSLVICVGAMAVVGSLQDGLTGDAAMLYTKSVLDFILVMIFASTMGVGV